LNYYIFTI